MLQSRGGDDLSFTVSAERSSKGKKKKRNGFKMQWEDAESRIRGKTFYPLGNRRGGEGGAIFEEETRAVRLKGGGWSEERTRKGAALCCPEKECIAKKKGDREGLINQPIGSHIAEERKKLARRGGKTP